MALPARDLTQLLQDLRRTRALVTPEELAHRLPPTMPTGLGELDRLLGGGLPQGRIVEISEVKGALGTTLSLQILARFTGSGRLAALVDRGDAFDPRGAAEAGVDLARLLWCRPATHRDAVRAADTLLASGAFALVVLDLGPAPQRGRRVPPRVIAEAGAASRGPTGQGGASRMAQAAYGQGDGSRMRTAQQPGPALRVVGSAAPALTEPQLIRTAPGEGAPPDELHYEAYATRKKRSDPRDDTISQAAWLRLARDAETARASLLVLGGEGAGTFASASLQPLRSRALFLGEGPGRTFEGLEIIMALERNKLGLSRGEARLSFRAPELFPTAIRDPLPGAARIADDPAASRRKAWQTAAEEDAP